MSALISNYWDNTAKFIFVSTHAKKAQQMQIMNFFYVVGALNAIVISNYKVVEVRLEPKVSFKNLL
jgi:hypothetical protein